MGEGKTGWVRLSEERSVYWSRVKMSSKWRHELGNASQSRSAEDESMSSLVAFWLGGQYFQHILWTQNFNDQTSHFLVEPNITTQNPLTMNGHSQSLETDAVKKSKDRAQLPC